MIDYKSFLGCLQPRLISIKGSKGANIKAAWVKSAYTKDAYIKNIYTRDACIKDNYSRGAYIRSVSIKVVFIKRACCVRNTCIGDANIGGVYIDSTLECLRINSQSSWISEIGPYNTGLWSSIDLLLSRYGFIDMFFKLKTRVKAS